jgi:hypothetical protein
MDLMAFEHFSQLLTFCRMQEIDLRMFISPSHAWDMERIRLYGRWDDQEHWKRRLVATIEAEAMHNRDSTSLPLWDFSGYNEVTTESVPPAGDKSSHMKWYWEASHYTNTTGDAVLKVVFAPAGSADAIPAGGFGTRLTSANIEDHLRITRQKGADFRQRNPSDLAEIEAEVARNLKPNALSAMK